MSFFKCEFIDEDGYFSAESVNSIKNALETALNKFIKPDFNVSLNITAVGASEIQRLNRETRDTDKVTDVLSYPMLEFSSPKVLKDKLMPWDFDPEDNSVFIGDIILCKDRIEEQAQEYGHSFLRESVYLSVHGLLHVFGYDHMTDEDKKIMRAEEKKIMAELEILN